MSIQPVRTLYVHAAETPRLIQGMLNAVREPSLEVQYSKSVWEAGSQLRDGDIEVVLLDLQPHEIHDVNSVTCLHAIVPEVPVFVVTSDVKNNLVLRSMQAYAENCQDTRLLTVATLRRSIWHAVQHSRRRTEAALQICALKESEANFRSLVVSSCNGFVVVSKTGEVVFANASAARLLGRPAGELRGEMLGFPFTDKARSECTGNGVPGVEVKIVLGEWDGAPVWFASIFDITTYVQGRCRLEASNTRLKRMNQRLVRLAKTDQLTGLLNRRGLEAALSSEVARSSRSGRPLMAVLLDCDDFKSVNDSLGYSVGDSVLKQVAQRLQVALRPSDLVGRVGGDEFIVLLPETRTAEALVVAERLRFAICGRPMRVLSKRIHVSASMGLAEISDETSSIDEVLVNTEVALKHSKHNGKNVLSSKNMLAAGCSDDGPGEKGPMSLVMGQQEALNQAERAHPRRGRPELRALLHLPSSTHKGLPRLPE